jgi:hypothetical protein
MDGVAPATPAPTLNMLAMPSIARYFFTAVRAA